MGADRPRRLGERRRGQALFTHLLPGWFGAVTGSMLIIFSSFCFVAAVWREAVHVSPPRAPDVRRLPGFVLLGLNGFLVIVDCAALVGVWLARG